MSKFRMVVLFACGIASAFACGSATTTLGGDKPTGDGNGGGSDAGLDEDGASASGGSGADASGDSGGSSFTPGDASFIDAARPLPCNLPEMPPVENPTAEEIEQSVTGSRATCDYGPGALSACDIVCPVGSNYFQISCGGPEGLPVRCTCGVNGNAIGDFNFEDVMEPFYASDCEDAATQAANGWCVNRLDCCVKYFDGTKDVCTCGSDPARLHMSSCEAIAEYTHGTVVDICPQYEFDQTTSTCWPPPCYY